MHSQHLRNHVFISHPSSLFPLSNLWASSHHYALNFSGASNLLASLHHTGRRRIVLVHTLNTMQHVMRKKFHNALGKFKVLCLASSTAVLGCMQPVGHRVDTPAAYFLSIINGDLSLTFPPLEAWV